MKVNEELIQLMKAIRASVPDGTSTEFESNGIVCSINKGDDSFNISIRFEPEKTEDFDDTFIKITIEAYKQVLDNLDDDIFVEVAEKISKELNMKEFDSLLNQTKFTQEEAQKLEEMIGISSDIINDVISSKLEKLIKVLF